MALIEFRRYKAKGEYLVDKEGTPDETEFITVAKDDILAYPKVVHRTYPTPVEKHMDLTLKPFLNRALDVDMTILSVFEKKLGLPEGALAKLHSLEEPSGSEARVLRSPAKLTSADPSKSKIALQAHTDLGSLAFLHNRLGGLQVLPPGTDNWQYVRPLPGHAICNIGDTLALLSGGILQSSMHRVVPPPGVQGDLPRWSMVYQMRPSQNVQLRALTDQSPVIGAAFDRLSPEQQAKFSPKATAGEWYIRRVKNVRISNYTVSIVYRCDASTSANVIDIGSGELGGKQRHGALDTNLIRGGKAIASQELSEKKLSYICFHICM